MMGLMGWWDASTYRKVTDMTDTLNTTTTTVTVKASELARVLANVSTFSSTGKDARPTLSAVLLERQEGEDLRAVATDSFTLAYEEISPADDTPEAPAGFSTLIDLADAKRLIPILKAEGAYATATISRDELGVTFTMFAGSLSVRPIEGEFPQYRRLLPEPGENDGVAMIGLNPKYLARFAKVVPVEDVGIRAKGRGSIPARFSFISELKPVMVRIGERFTGLIMPVRIK